jgi:hypothetical protein
MKKGFRFQTKKWGMTIFGICLMYLLIGAFYMPVGFAQNSGLLQMERSILPNTINQTIGAQKTLRYHFTGDPIVKPQVPREIVLVIDASGSMGWGIGGRDDTSKPDRMALAKTAAIEFVEFFRGQNVKIGVVRYASGASIVQGLLSVESHTGAQQVISAIQNINAEGGTATGDGYRTAYYMLKNSASNASKNIVLMTDGEANEVRFNNTSIRASNYYLSSGTGGHSEYLPWYYGTPSNPADSHPNVALFGDGYAKHFANLSKQSGFQSFVIGFATNAHINTRLRSIAELADPKGFGKFYNASSGQKLNEAYNQIGLEIESDLEFAEIRFIDVLPEGVAPKTPLPQGITSRFSNGIYTVTGIIENVLLEKVPNAERTYRIKPFYRDLEFTYTTGGEKNFNDIDITFRDHEGIRRKGVNLNNPKVLVLSELMKFSRKLTGSVWYQTKVDALQTNPLPENEVINQNVAALGEKGYLEYLFTGDPITFSEQEVAQMGTNPVYLKNVQLKESLPDGVKAVNLPQGFTQSLAGGIYTINGPVQNLSMLKVDGLTNTYQLAPQTIRFEILYEKEGMKTLALQSAAITYEHPVEGKKSGVSLNGPKMGVFTVDIPRNPDQRRCQRSRKERHYIPELIWWGRKRGNDQNG